MRLLIVDGDHELRLNLTGQLTQSGYEVSAHENGDHAFESLLCGYHDLAIVDLNIPGMDGLTLIRNLRQRKKDLPILIITVRNSLGDRITGLEVGADDYLIKPFEFAEFEARIKALLRRKDNFRTREIRVGPLVMTPHNPRIQLGSKVIDLPAGELSLLEILASHAGQVVSKDKIAEQLTHNGNTPSEAAIEVSVHRLRSRLGPFGSKVKNLRGFGYLLDAHSDKN